MLTVAELRKHVETALEDVALQRLLDAALEEIRSYTHSEIITPIGDWLPLSHEAASITTITENGEALNADDFRLSGNGSVVVRRNDGTIPRRRWYGPIEVDYTARTNEATREVVQIALVEFDINFNPGILQQTAGNWNEMSVTDVRKARAHILSRLSRGVVWPV